MARFNTVLFDLDGTLTDSKEGIINSLMFAFRKMDLDIPSFDELLSLIGPPFIPALQEFFQMTPAQASKTVEFYHEYYCRQGIFENRLYEGIPELLSELAAADKQLILATSKSTQFAIQILHHFQINQYFYQVVGRNLDQTRQNKDEVIGYILANFPTVATKDTVMVGDRKYDVLGAQKWQLPSIAVTYGYGSRAELQKASPTFMVHSINQLRELLLG